MKGIVDDCEGRDAAPTMASSSLASPIKSCNDPRLMSFICSDKSSCGRATSAASALADGCEFIDGSPLLSPMGWKRPTPLGS